MGIISNSTGSPGTVASASGGKVTGFNNISEFLAVIVLTANPQRQSITFHNPGTSDIFVYPLYNAQGATQVPGNSSLGGTFRIYGNGSTLVISGECQFPWYAFAITGAGNNNAFTAMESNI